ncbi:MAG: aldehyde dehydrogenase family protein, partial [Ginsengibacter sp.]
MQIINPATEEIISNIGEDTKESLQNKFRSLRSAASSWQGQPLKKRIEVIQVFATCLQENIESLASTLTSETGKP